MERPDIFTYLDYRQYLRDWYAWKKHSNPRYSHRAFVRRTGQRSPSLLVDVMERRRNLPESTAIAFADTMSLSTTEARFFRTLVRFDQAGTHQEKQEAWTSISSSRRFREARPIEGPMFECLAHWYISAIRELATVPGFQDDPRWIARRLRPQISTSQARKALEALFATGLLVRAEDTGEVLLGAPAFRTADQVQGMAVHAYHDGMLGLARDAIERFDPEHRYFLAVTQAVPMSTLPQLKELMGEMHRRLVELVSTHDGDPDEVLQVQLHFFPLTDVPEPEDSP